MEEKMFDLHPSGHPRHDTALANLASYLNGHYQKQGNLTDLNRAIGLNGKCLELCPSSYQDHGLVLYNLESTLINHYNEVQKHSDLIRAIKMLKEALATYPVQHSSFAFIAGELAAAILLPFKSSLPDQPLPLDEAFENYRLLKKCGPAVSLDLWDATQAWVKDAEEYNHSSVLEAYQTSLNTLDHFTSFNSFLDSRHETFMYPFLAHSTMSFNSVRIYRHLPRTHMHMEIIEGPGSSRCCGSVESARKCRWKSGSYLYTSEFGEFN